MLPLSGNWPSSFVQVGRDQSWDSDDESSNQSQGDHKMIPV